MPEPAEKWEPLKGSGARIVWGLAGAVGLVCSLALFGWWFHHSALVGLFPEAATMKPNTALGLLLLAVSLALQSCGGRVAQVGRVVGAFVILVFAATLFEYVAGVDLHIDRLLADVPPERAGDPLCRMSTGTAVCGLLLGGAAVWIEALPFAGAVLAASASSLSLSALVGYLFDAAPLLGVPALRSMTVRTAGCFLLLSVVYFLLHPEREPARSLLYSTRHHRTGLWFVVGTCTLPILFGLPAAALYRHGWIEANFSLAILVVALMVAQALLIVKNSQSLAAVEEHRTRAETDRAKLAAENETQHAVVRASERKAAQSEAQYRLISDALPALVSYLDRDLCYVNVNRTYETWFGVSAAAMEGKSLEPLLGDAAQEIRPHLEAALLGAPQQFETTLLTLQGERIVQVSHIPDVDAEGLVRGVIVQANDITGRKREEAALRKTEKLAAVGKLASSIAHEINNPLESVMNLLYLAKEGAQVPEVREYLTMAEEELKRVASIASQTLRFHKQTTKPSAMDARDLFRSVLTIYRPRLAGAMSLEERHRPARAVTCLDGEIRQVLNNLVGNALDAMGSRGRLIIRSRAATCCTTGREGISFTVADNGTGMSAKTLATIFEAFFTTKGMHGTGLGLWVSKEIVDRHGGSLRVRSSQKEHSHGTVFRLFLPYEPALAHVA